VEWGALRAQLERRQVLQDDGERLMLLLRYAGTAAEAGQGQRVEVAQAEVLGQPWVALWADICPASEIEPRRALVHNTSLAVGSICIEGDHYFIRHAAPLAGLLPGHLDQMIDLVAHEAARLRAIRLRVLGYAPAAGDQAAGHYAE
jgi:hypothetical protein